MNRYLQSIGFVLLLALLCACKTPYTPAPITTVNNYLVVEGLINITDSTYISLSRSVNVMAKTTVKPELKATITIESNQGNSYPLKEIGNGVYGAPNYNLSAANQYRIRVKATNGSTYLSDFVQTKVTPPIDSIIRDMKPDGIHININTHDPQNNTRYYKWNFAEAWQFTSYYQSFATAENAATSPLYLGSGIAVVPRTKDIYHCWGNDVSATILNSTAGLSQDILNGQPITFVPSSSEKLSVRYSILIRQYALTKDAYDFWTLLKKNTQDLGTIFDSQPSASVGNIHNITNPAEPVIGFISAGTVSQIRIYINYTDLPKSYVDDYLNNTPYNKYTCGLDTLDANPTAQKSQLSYLIESYPHADQIPVKILTPFNQVTLAGSATGSSPPCVDCTLRGTNVKPIFWQ